MPSHGRGFRSRCRSKTDHQKMDSERGRKLRDDRGSYRRYRSPHKNPHISQDKYRKGRSRSRDRERYVPVSQETLRKGRSRSRGHDRYFLHSRSRDRERYAPVSQETRRKWHSRSRGHDRHFLHSQSDRSLHRTSQNKGYEQKRQTWSRNDKLWNRNVRTDPPASLHIRKKNPEMVSKCEVLQRQREEERKRKTIRMLKKEQMRAAEMSLSYEERVIREKKRRSYEGGRHDPELEYNALRMKRLSEYYSQEKFYDQNGKAHLNQIAATNVKDEAVLDSDSESDGHWPNDEEKSTFTYDQWRKEIETSEDVPRRSPLFKRQGPRCMEDCQCVMNPSKMPQDSMSSVLQNLRNGLIDAGDWPFERWTVQETAFGTRRGSRKMHLDVLNVLLMNTCHELKMENAKRIEKEDTEMSMMELRQMRSAMHPNQLEIINDENKRLTETQKKRIDDLTAMRKDMKSRIKEQRNMDASTWCDPRKKHALEPTVEFSRRRMVPTEREEYIEMKDRCKCALDSLARSRQRALLKKQLDNRYIEVYDPPMDAGVYLRKKTMEQCSAESDIQDHKLFVCEADSSEDHINDDLTPPPRKRLLRKEQLTELQYHIRAAAFNNDEALNGTPWTRKEPTNLIRSELARDLRFGTGSLAKKKAQVIEKKKINKLCQFFQKEGRICSRGKRCRFIHSDMDVSRAC